jgi:preprotein translocase subunit SecD
MERNWVPRAVAYLLLTLLACLFLTPTVASWMGKEESLPPWLGKIVKNKIQLGLDLQGGLRLIYEVQVDKAVSDKADRIAADLEEKLRKEKKISDVRAERFGIDQIVLQFKKPEDAKGVNRDFLKDFRRYLYEESRDDKTGEVKLRIDNDYIDEQRDYAIRQGVETIRNRVDKMGVAEASIRRTGNKIAVELPGLKPADFERVKKQIGRTAQLEFKMVDDGSEYMKRVAGVVAEKKAELPGIEVRRDAWNEKDSGITHQDVYLWSKDKGELERFFASLTGDLAVPSDHEIGYQEVSPRDEGTDDEEGEDGAKREKGVRGWRSYYLHRRAEVTGEYIQDAQVNWDQQTGRPEVGIEFDHQGANLFEKVSGANIGRKMAIILDERIDSAPVIESRIGGGRARITMGGFGDAFQLQEEAKNLVGVLKSGALPAPLKKTLETQVGPTLGRDAVDKARLSMMIGSIAVILFMMFYYRFSGLIANVAMVVNIILQLAVLAAFSGTLTLPGIAGVVLTIGMAVDANIIIYERIREELRAGKSPRSAVEAGFGRAFWTVFDAHIANLVAGIVLYSYGTKEIRSFAVLLMIGIAANLFTSVWLSRAMFDAYVGRRNTTSLSI